MLSTVSEQGLGRLGRALNLEMEDMGSRNYYIVASCVVLNDSLSY